MNAEAMPATKNAKMPAITTPSVNVEASWRTAGGRRWISRWWERLDMAPSFNAVSPRRENAPKRNPFRSIYPKNIVLDGVAMGARNASAPPDVSFPSKHAIEEGFDHEHDHEQRQRHV